MPRRTAAVAVVTLLVACQSGTEPTAERQSPEAPQPSFSETCEASPQQCDQIQREIEDLQNHPNPVCQTYGTEAARRYSDPHAYANRFDDGTISVFFYYPDGEHVHEDAPYQPGSSLIDFSGGNVQGQIARNEADALYQNGTWAAQNCGS